MRDLTILMDDNPMLREVSQPVEEFRTDALYQLLSDMEEALRQRGGRGLAAVQIGVLLRVLIIKQDGYYAMVNPSLTRVLNRHTIEHEGCLSVPVFKWGDVSRPAKCDVTWFTPDGQERSASLAGETARIFQHEFDHLSGVLMTDRKAA